MALRKFCDNDQKSLTDGEFVQLRGTVCDQWEHDGITEFRYLTPKPGDYTFCNDACEMEWRARQRTRRSFKMV